MAKILSQLAAKCASRIIKSVSLVYVCDGHRQSVWIIFVCEYCYCVLLYSSLNKHNYFYFHSLIAGLMVLIVGGFLQIFLQSSLFEVALSFTGTILFSLFLIFDTQQMMVYLSPEEYILATVNLYMDILNLFLYILRILNELNRN